MSPLVNAATTALLQFVWQGAVVAIALSVMLALLPERAASARYLASCLAMVALVVLPVITGVLSFTTSGDFVFAMFTPVSGNVVLATIQLWTFPLWACGAAVSS